MNVDLLKNNPAWTTCLYIAVPLFICVLLSVRFLKIGQKYGPRLVKALQPKALYAWAQEIIQKLRRGLDLGPDPLQDIELGLHASATTPEDTNFAAAAFRNAWYEVLIAKLKGFDPVTQEDLLMNVLPKIVEEVEATGDMEATRRILWGIVKLVDQAGYNDILNGMVDMPRGLDELLGRAMVVAVRGEHTDLVRRILQYTSSSTSGHSPLKYPRVRNG